MGRGRRPFADRREAGRVLGAEVAARLGRDAGDVVVLGLPRGGVIVAAEVAATLSAPLDVVPVRKLGLPWQPELAMGAIAAAGDAVEAVRTEAVLSRADIDAESFEAVRQRELTELRRREAAYRDGRTPVPLAGRTVVVVDDGLATGATMRAAVAALRRSEPSRVVVAVPVGSPHTCADLASLVDEVVCLWSPEAFSAVGQGYTDFSPTSDDEVRAALGAALSG